MAISINYKHYTSTGDRHINQDYCTHHITQNSALFITADGLGGHQAGEKISKAFCETMLDLAPTYTTHLQKNNAKDTLLNWFNQALKIMAADDAQASALQDAHTTFALLWLDTTQTITAHIGDSRIYQITENKITRTRDHSVPQMLLDEGDITEQEMGNHPDQNRLTRSVSLANKHQPTIKTHTAAKINDHFILCTDGFWSYSTDQELLLLSQGKITEQTLIDQSNTAIKRAKGKSDNVTVQWIKVESDK